MTTEVKTLIDLKREYTIEEFDLLPEPGDDNYYELVEGEIRLVPAAGGEHSNISGIIWRAILLFDLRNN
jgi:Uma2 family endonuclease